MLIPQLVQLELQTLELKQSVFFKARQQLQLLVKKYL
jgi:hypothetical protein